MIDPSGATNGQVLTFNGSTSTWVASAAPTGGSNIYTTVGNASAGIFVSAVCFIPSDPGTGTWTAPAGCYTARVTIVGGGKGGPTNGTRSHFNYPTGSTTGANQLFADGGGNNFVGGNAGWNGINNLAIGAPTESAGGGGGSGGGGYGGGGGAASDDGYGGSYGRGGGYAATGCGGGSGGVGGDGTNGGNSVGEGGGSPTLSYAATILSNFSASIAQNPGRGAGPAGHDAGGGGGWCSAIVSVTPNQSYTYSVGVGGAGAGNGMVVIEW